MKWSWTVGRLAGITLRVHVTFFFLLAWLAVVDYRSSGTLSGALIGMLFTLALFGSVLLHELGHAVAARRVGVPTRDITLLPIGGVARLAFIPDKPKDELRIALAGPAVTVLIALTLSASLRIAGLPVMADEDPVTHGTIGIFLGELVWVNVALLVFNMLPAFPMDGGRVLRALLALRMEYARATEIAARVGRAFAVVFGVVGMLYNPLLVIIALFIWVSAAAEALELRQRSALTGVPVAELMIRDVRTLSPRDTLRDALREVLGGFQRDFPVVDGGSVVGLLAHADLLQALAKRGTDTAVGSVMDASPRTVAPAETALHALTRLREGRSRTMPVVSDGKLYGLLTTDTMADFVAIDAALHGSTHGAQPGGAHWPRLHPAGR